MSPWPATLAKDRTADGHWVLLPGGHYAVGQEVVVDIDSRAVREFKSGDETILTECVEIASTQEPKVLMPVEILDGI